VWWWMATALAGPCSASGLSEGVTAFSAVRAEVLPELAAMATAEACRLPKGAEEALRSIAQVGPSHRPLLDLQLATEAVDLWVAACPAGPKVLADQATLAPNERRGALWTACGLDEERGFSEAEWLAAPGPLVVAPILVPAFLASQGVDAPTVRAYARALAGISDRPEDNQVDTFEPLYP